MCDETPTRLRLDEWMAEEQGALSLTDSCGNTRASRGAQEIQRPKVVKVNQQDFWISVAVTGSLTQHRPQVFTWQLAVPLHAIQSTTAESLAQSFKLGCALPVIQTIIPAFKVEVRASTMDKVGGCMRFL